VKTNGGRQFEEPTSFFACKDSLRKGMRVAFPS
jgi:hypothetical protein